MVITPSIDSFYFTAGKRYPVRVHGPGCSDKLGEVTDDRGFTRAVAIDRLGQRCPHLHPKNVPAQCCVGLSFGDIIRKDQDSWRAAGHWRIAE